MFLKRSIGPALLILLLLMAGCAQAATVTPTATPTAMAVVQPVTTRQGRVVASGEVLPAQKADLGFSTAGRVQSVAVAVGDSVAAGDVLIVLDQVAAKASLQQLYNGPREADRIAAEFA